MDYESIAGNKQTGGIGLRQGVDRGGEYNGPPSQLATSTEEQFCVLRRKRKKTREKQKVEGEVETARISSYPLDDWGAVLFI